MSITNTAKTGLKYYGYYKSITSLFFGIVLFVIGIYLSIKKYTRTAFTNAKVNNDPECEKVNSKKNDRSYSCRLQLKYVVDDQEFLEDYTLSGGNKKYKNDKVHIRYNPEDPSSFDTFPFSPRYIGYFLCAIAFFTILYGLTCINFPMFCGGVALAQNVTSAIKPSRPSKGMSFGSNGFKMTY
jgi:hypothetical protein